MFLPVNINDVVHIISLDDNTTFNEIVSTATNYCNSIDKSECITSVVMQLFDRCNSYRVSKGLSYLQAIFITVPNCPKITEEQKKELETTKEDIETVYENLKTAVGNDYETIAKTIPEFAKKGRDSLFKDPFKTLILFLCYYYDEDLEHVLFMKVQDESISTRVLENILFDFDFGASTLVYEEIWRNGIVQNMYKIAKLTRKLQEQLQ